MFVRELYDYMNRKTICRQPKSGINNARRRSYIIAPFLDNKVVTLLKEDSKKIDSGNAEWNGKLNRYIISLIRNDLRERELL